ncbi:MAG: alpha/beta fold hydrolase [Blastococcus sp.]|jgi:pimeloyl-ACP methyl ester carboxylesterase/predicted glycosyltransferase|nr:alpha/beta fold hydrolase [Blastococcus sp.]
MRARYPDVQGVVERDGVRVGYDVYGEPGTPTLVLLTSWAIVHARQWKAQIPYLARHFRVITVEGRGNGRADRPDREEAYADDEYVADVLAVMDETATGRAVLVGLSLGSRHALQFAARHPERVAGVVAMGALFASGAAPDFDVEQPEYEGWAKYNRHYWLADYPGFVEFFIAEVFPEPHSTKQREDGVGWGLETDGPTLLRTRNERARPTAEEAEATCRQVQCPVLVVHGDLDTVVPLTEGVDIARWTGGELVVVAGGGHAPPMREPVLTNRLIRDFGRAHLPGGGGSRTWTRARDRRRRALFVCSPIGLGHVRRDLAIADELRVLHPDLQIDWLTQHPVTRVLEERGERVHPASRFLAGETAHLESEAGEHELRVFGSVRRMDEILVANFMVFADLVEEEPYDLWIADEGWDVDAFLHDNPELKRAPYAWLTDFTGWLPMADGGAAEAALTADWNAERVERGRRYPRLRDRSVFVGNPDDVVDAPLGPGLPTANEWARERYAFGGYVLGSPPPADRAELRADLGYAADEQVCVVTVGGSGVGESLLRRTGEAFALAEKRVPGLRMVLVTGPRIEPAAVPVPPGVEVRGYLPDLDRHLAACDLAVVQGGLSTTMELTAAGRPFLYVPLTGHFEQQVHVPHRLGRYRAGRRLDYADAADPERLAEAIATEIGRPTDYRPVETDGAARTARLLAELL